MRENFKKISTFLAWAVFTFLSHFSAKKFLSSSNHLSENVIVLTSLQMAVGAVIYLNLMIGGRGEVRIHIIIHDCSPNHISDQTTKLECVMLRFRN